MLPPLASEHYRDQQRRALATMLDTRREWLTIGDDFDRGWRRVGPRLALLVASAQAGSAESGAEYVAASLLAQGTPVQPEAGIRARALAGIASDGRSLEQLLYGAVIHSRTAKVDSLPQRLEVGRMWLDKAVQTQVADAGRDAAKVAMAVRPSVRWVRMVTPPCCQRCAVLAGDARTYSHEFKRHPGCNCTMIPTTVANPDFAGQALGPGDITDLTSKQRDALAGGANFHSTINDYQRKRAGFSGYLPPTRVDKVIDRAGQRDKAMDALARIGVLI